MVLAVRCYGTALPGNLECNDDQCGSHCREVSFHIVAIAETVKFLLTHCGRVTQICVFTLQLCRTGDADLSF